MIWQTEEKYRISMEHKVLGMYGIYKYVCVLVYTPSLLRILRVFQNQYKQISQNHPENPQVVICSATWSLFPEGHGPLYNGT